MQPAGDPYGVPLSPGRGAAFLNNLFLATGTVGEWGIGLPGTEGTPDKKGFDYSFGFYDQARSHVLSALLDDMDWSYRHNHEPECLHTHDDDGLVQPRGVRDPVAARNSAVMCQERALQFIDSHRNEPFFLYYSTQLPHGPVIAPYLETVKDKPWSQNQ